VGGKLIWRCLETNSHTVAKATMSRWGRPRGPPTFWRSANSPRSACLRAGPQRHEVAGCPKPSGWKVRSFQQSTNSTHRKRAGESASRREPSRGGAGSEPENEVTGFTVCCGGFAPSRARLAYFRPR